MRIVIQIPNGVTIANECGNGVAMRSRLNMLDELNPYVGSRIRRVLDEQALRPLHLSQKVTRDILPLLTIRLDVRSISLVSSCSCIRVSVSKYNTAKGE